MLELLDYVVIVLLILTVGLTVYIRVVRVFKTVSEALADGNLTEEEAKDIIEKITSLRTFLIGLKAN